MFSGLSVCDLGNDLFSPDWASFPNHFLSLAEVLSLAGYRTVAFPDHPFFYGLSPRHGGDMAHSLLRGFQQFSVVNDFGRFGVRTNIGTQGGKVEVTHTLAGPPASAAEVAAEVARFNAGRLRLDPDREGDLDAVRDVHLARLDGLFASSPYLRKRYLEPFDRHVFESGEGQPYFLFLNLHMATHVALPEPALYAQWCARTLMLNATAKGLRLPVVSEPVAEWVVRTYTQLGLRHDGARPYEHITRVPLVIRFPAGSELATLHRRYEERVSLTDVFSTVLEVALGAGVFERNLPIRGRSLVSRIRENDFDPVQVTETTVAPDGYASEPLAAGHAKAVYWRRYKLILMPDPWRVVDQNWPTNVPLDGSLPGRAARANPRLGREVAWLYDIAADPHERDDLAPAHPDTVAAMKRLVGDRWSCRPLGPAARRRPPDEWDPEALETLRALGYIR
jgi:hypothetical protein